MHALTRTQYMGGDEGAFRFPNHDLRGIRLLNEIDVPGLCTLAACVVDYAGHRLVAQALVPGEGEGKSKTTTT